MIELHASYSTESPGEPRLFMWARDADGEPLQRDRLYRLLQTVAHESGIKSAAFAFLASELLYLPDPDGSRDGEPETAFLVEQLAAIVWLTHADVAHVAGPLLTANMPDGVVLAPSAKFWFTVARWVEHLAAREQVLPGIRNVYDYAKGQPAAVWLPLPTERVLRDFRRFVESMPLACCASRWERLTQSMDEDETAVFIERVKAGTLELFIQEHVDGVVREALSGPLPLSVQYGGPVFKSFVQELFGKRRFLRSAMSESSQRKVADALRQWSEVALHGYDRPTPPARLVLRLAPVEEGLWGVAGGEARVAGGKARVAGGGSRPVDGGSRGTDGRWRAAVRWELQFWIGDDGDPENSGNAGNVGTAGGVGNAGDVGTAESVGTAGSVGTAEGVGNGESVGNAGDVGSAGGVGTAESGEGPEGGFPLQPLPQLWDSEEPVDSARRAWSLRRVAALAHRFPVFARLVDELSADWHFVPPPDGSGSAASIRGTGTASSSGRISAVGLAPFVASLSSAGSVSATGSGPRSRTKPEAIVPKTPRPPAAVALEDHEVYWLLRADTRSELEREGVTVEIPAWMTGPRVKPRVQISLRPAAKGLFKADSLVDFQWRAAVDGVEIDEDAFRAIVGSKLPLLRRGDEWIVLDEVALEALHRLGTAGTGSTDSADTSGADTADTAGAAGTAGTASAADIAAVLEELETAVEVTVEVPDDRTDSSFARVWSLFRGEFKFEDVPVPEGLRGELRPHQRRGLSWLALMGELGLGACLADDMGLGKTIQVIAYLLHLKERGEAQGHHLVICPTSVVANWQREIVRFAPQFRVHIHHGPGRPTGDDFLAMLEEDRPDILITSYGIALRDVDTLRRGNWHAVVVDEAQQIKNPRAMQSRAVKSLPALQRIALTGTPIENRLEELWSIMDFLNPRFLGSEQQFVRNFASPIERFGDGRAARRLRAMVRPFILRRMKEDESIAPELPEKLQEKVYCGLTAEQAALYQATVEHMMARIEGSAGMQRRGLVLATLTRLKQICNHPALAMKENRSEPSRWGPSRSEPSRSGKLQMLIRILKRVLAAGEKALVFTQYAATGRLLQETLAQTFDTEVPLLHGGIARAARDEMVERFQRDDGPPLFVLSLKAGGVGINLTRATHVFHFDRWWNPAVESQATDRAYRIGQTESVNVHTFICRGTLEERIDAMIEQKRKLAEDIVESGENWITELDTEELREMFALSEAVGRSGSVSPAAPDRRADDLGSALVTSDSEAVMDR